MNLNTTQLQTIKAWINANNGGAFDQSAVDLLNAVAAPDFWVWRTAVSKHELVTQPSVDGTTFTWAGNGFITRSAGEQACWTELFNSTLTTNPSLPNVRQAFSDIFSGTGNAAANRVHLLASGRRKATVAEKMFATGTGSTASPATMAIGAEGAVTIDNVVDAANS